MPLIGIFRFFIALFSLALLALGLYLAWSWWQGDWVRLADGDLVRVREDWRAWVGGGLMGLMLFGRPLVLLMLARPDDARSAAAEANAGSGREAMLSSTTGAQLHVQTLGAEGGPRIIFTHGWGLDSSMWGAAKTDLAARFHLTFWDLPGLGKSKRPPDGEVALERFADDLAALLLTVDEARPAVLVGHSIGGMTIQTLVRDHPKALSRVAGIVLLNTTYTNPLKTMVFSGLMRALQKPLLEPAMKLMIALNPLVWLSMWQSYFSGAAHVANRLGFGRFVTRSQLERVALLTTRNDPAVQARGNLAMFRWDATRVMARTATPVLVIGGAMDIITKVEASRTIVAQAWKGEGRTIEGVNHMGPMERADLYNALIADFTLAVQRRAAPGARSFAAGDDLAAGEGEREDRSGRGGPSPLSSAT